MIDACVSQHIVAYIGAFLKKWKFDLIIYSSRIRNKLLLLFSNATCLVNLPSEFLLDKNFGKCYMARKFEQFNPNLTPNEPELSNQTNATCESEFQFGLVRVRIFNPNGFNSLIRLGCNQTKTRTTRTLAILLRSTQIIKERSW